MFDTLRYARKLEEVGVSREHAEAHVRLMAEIVESDLSTKQDVKDLRDELQKLEYRLTIRVGVLVASLNAAMISFIQFLK